MSSTDNTIPNESNTIGGNAGAGDISNNVNNSNNTSNSSNNTNVDEIDEDAVTPITPLSASAGTSITAPNPMTIAWHEPLFILSRFLTGKPGEWAWASLEPARISPGAMPQSQMDVTVDEILARLALEVRAVLSNQPDSLCVPSRFAHDFLSLGILVHGNLFQQLCMGSG
jgi:hypothetical protein